MIKFDCLYERGMTVTMKILQPLLSALVIALTALTFAALSPVDAAISGADMEVPFSVPLEFAADDMKARLSQSQNCPCPSEKKEVGCSLELCSSGIVQTTLPESRQLTAIPYPGLRGDLTGIAKEPDRIPPRPLV